MQVVAHTEGINPSNALELLQQYDIIVDATDNAPTRYLLSDACSIAHKPLVSGAAIGLDGQLTVYCHGPSGELVFITMEFSSACMSHGFFQVRLHCCRKLQISACACTPASAQSSQPYKL